MALQPALLGGLFIGVLGALPIVNVCDCCCLWMIGGGLVAAYLDQQQDVRPTTVQRGALAGLLAGVAGAFVWLVVASIVSVVLAPVQEQMITAVTRNARDMPPEIREWLDQMAGTEPSAAGTFVWFGVRLVLGSVFASIGGAIGASYFRKDVPPALGGPVEPPQLP